MNAEHPCRVRKPLFTTGTIILLVFMAVGFSFGLARFFTGLGAVTNLDNRFPWGIWIAIDVACGVALAAGGFTSAALIEIFGLRKYRPLLRPAVLTAWLGYAMVAFALVFDLGQYWNMWQPIFHWQGNSVLFEVGMCVMAYLVVLTFEMAPPVAEGLIERAERNEWGSFLLRRVERPLHVTRTAIRVMLPLFIIAGVVLSCMHQSSLGTLMVIAPTKLSPFWYTPLLPVLFLLSAVMVGFPMVICESIIASRSLGRAPEMGLLGGLAKKIPWFIGAYAIVVFGSLIAKREALDPFLHPGCTVALAVEIVAGLILPFALLMFEGVRRSPGWLLAASMLIVLGVVINRVNVFLVGFHPLYPGKAYFPAIGEIAVTVAIVCTIMFLYRVLISLFPILTGPECIEVYAAESGGETVAPPLQWGFRGLAVLLLLSFVVLYAAVHRQSQAESSRTRQRLHAAHRAEERLPVVQPAEHSFRPGSYQALYVLNNPRLNEAVDDYEPVKFSHRSHDNTTGGNCASCHHRTAFNDPSDRVGEDLVELHRFMDIRLGQACSSCHGDMEENRPEGCADCHGLAGERDHPSRPGLMGAYHRLCIGCHERRPAVRTTQTGCSDCHHPRTPDHGRWIAFAGEPGPREVTATCLRCHEAVGKEILRTVHWNWGGHSPKVVGHEHETRLGMATVLNNYLIGVGPNVRHCADCHISTGRGSPSFDSEDVTGIDCLLCHDTTGDYRRAKGTGGLPQRGIDLAKAAASVGRPTRKNCGQCHFYCAGGPNVKHGDLEPILENPPPELDVHMGRYDFRCQDCHETRHHGIAGHSMSAPATEGHVFCGQCHGENPHGISGLLGRHLNDHVQTVACETCHIPMVAKDTPTQLVLDYSSAGRGGEPVLDRYGKPSYAPRYGSMTWQDNLIPTYEWYDHTHDIYVLGEEIDSSGAVFLNSPVGTKEDPASRIYPFKVHVAFQPYDKENSILVVPKLEGGYWDHYDWDKAIREGMEAVGLAYSGTFGFRETKMYTSIHHEVMPARSALGCADCHAEQAIRCSRCHSSAEGTEVPVHAEEVYPEIERFVDFEALGYEGDPALTGGRFRARLGRGKPTM